MFNKLPRPPPAPKSRLYGIMWKKYVTARQATDDNVVRRMRTGCWIPMATHTHTHTYSEYVIYIVFCGKNGASKVPQCSFTSILPVLLSEFVIHLHFHSCFPIPLLYNFLLIPFCCFSFFSMTIFLF